MKKAAHNKKKDPFNTVIIRKSRGIRSGTIKAIIRQGMKDLDYTPAESFCEAQRGVCEQGGKLGTNAHTSTVVVASVLEELANIEGVKRVDLGENTGMRIPTRMFYKQAGYYDMIKDVKRRPARR